MTENESWFWLCNIQGIYRKKIKLLVEYYGMPIDIFNFTKSQIENINILTKQEQFDLVKSRKEKEIKENYEKLKGMNIEFVSMANNKYPKKLKNIPDAPCCLYIKGDLPDENIPSVAMIGARNCSNYGKEMALEYAKVLAENGVQIISGLARGIDSFSHEGALHVKGKTFGVLGCGVNICYPKENFNLYTGMIEEGGIISEYPINTKPLSMFFPERNRIISGLADIILVIEARERSGSLITTDLALEQGKDIFAVPGRVTDELSRGCNHLICQGAGIANSPKEIMNELGLKYEKNTKLFKKNNNLLERKENMVYSCLDLQPKSLDEILSSIDLEYREIMSILVDLEVKGLMKETSKNYYVRLI